MKETGSLNFFLEEQKVRLNCRIVTSENVEFLNQILKGSKKTLGAANYDQCVATTALLLRGLIHRIDQSVVRHTLY